MKEAEKKPFSLTGNALKFFAVFSMLVDHMAASLGPRVWGNIPYQIMRGFGRLAFPLFAFLIIEGVLHTRSVFRYGLRLLIFGLISEVPFDMAFYGRIWYPGYQNVYFTLLLGMIPVAVAYKLGLNSLILTGVPGYPEETKEGTEDSKHPSLGMRCAIFGLVFTGCMILSYVGKTDYGIFGVCLIAGLYFLKEEKFVRIAYVMSVLSVFDVTELLTFFSMMLTLAYRGEQGKGGSVLRLLFYLFYPVHLLLLGWISFTFFR